MRASHCSPRKLYQRTLPKSETLALLLPSSRLSILRRPITRETCHYLEVLMQIVESAGNPQELSCTLFLMINYTGDLYKRAHPDDRYDDRSADALDTDELVSFPTTLPALEADGN